MSQNYTNSEEYQREIAEQYKKRIVTFSEDEILRVLSLFGFNISENDLQEATAGNMNATYLTQDIVVKLNKNREDRMFVANAIVSEKLPNFPVVQVLVYDFFEKTNYEVLIMQRSSGDLLLDNLPDMKESQQEELFRQVCSVVRQCFEIQFDDFGDINSDISFSSYADYLRSNLQEYSALIREQNLCNEDDLQKIENYVLRHLNVFDNEKAVFIHDDLHMGNILYDGENLTAIIDFDSSRKAPKSMILRSLLAVAGHPSQYTEGTDAFPRYQGKTFLNLLPVFKEELSDVFADPQLVRKLNVNGIVEGLMWVSQNWSEGFNKEMIQELVENETSEHDEDLKNSFYGKMILI